MHKDDRISPDTADSRAAESNGEYIARTATGGWRLSGTRVSLDSIVDAYLGGANSGSHRDRFSVAFA